MVRSSGFRRRAHRQDGQHGFHGPCPRIGNQRCHSAGHRPDRGSQSSEPTGRKHSCAPPGSLGGGGPAVKNGNPFSLLSWANFLIEYNEWLDPAPSGEVSHVPGTTAPTRRTSCSSMEKTSAAGSKRKVSCTGTCGPGGIGSISSHRPGHSISIFRVSFRPRHSGSTPVGCSPECADRIGVWSGGWVTLPDRHSFLWCACTASSGNCGSRAGRLTSSVHCFRSS